jgi:acyl CoA:acetate/3-ketoacid CoA transferase beta subunit
MGEATRAEVCVVACAEAWRGDGEILASPMGVVPTLGARLARATFEPDLLVTDGEAMLVANDLPVGPGEHQKVVEAWLPFRHVFDLVWSGRRHVMMGATQLDRFGNQNISCIGDWRKPKVQLLGVRGSPGNTVNHATSYFVPKHTPRVFVERVDMVSGIGTRAAAEHPEARRFHDLRFVVTDLAVLDFGGAGGTLRLRSTHPGVTVEEVLAATGFDLEVPDDVPETRAPTGQELSLLRDVLDRRGLRDEEVAA